MDQQISEGDVPVRERLRLFSGGTGGIDSWLIGDQSELIFTRLAELPSQGLSCSQLNQLLALAYQAEVSDGFFRYYWLQAPSRHTYDVTRLPEYHDSYTRVDQILSLGQLYWGLYRIYVDCLLYYGAVEHGYLALRRMDLASLTQGFERRRYATDIMVHRGASLPLQEISQDDRYLIAEQACKSFEPVGEEIADLRAVLRGAWIEHLEGGGGKVTAKELLEGAHVLSAHGARQQQLMFAADEILNVEVASEEELLERYEGIKSSFMQARAAALRNTDLYLSMANDLDVYVATSMRNRQQFREMARACERIFSHSAVKSLHLRYFDPTLSAARGHEDKGLIECLMVKCAKVLIYTAGKNDSYGKDAEAAMALSLGKPVIFLCDEEHRRSFFSEIHPLSRLVNFETGVAVGALATSSSDDVSVLLARVFENDMRYILEQSKPGYFRLKEALTGSIVRLQTNNVLLRETFWNCYHRSGRS